LEDPLPGFAVQSILLCGVFVVDRQIFFDDGDVFLASRDPVFLQGSVSEMSWMKVIQNSGLRPLNLKVRGDFVPGGFEK